jgi:hypothetical protein
MHMSQSYSAIVVLRSGQWPVEHVIEELAPILQPGVAELHWELERLDDGCVLVPAPSKTLPGPWWWMDAPAHGYAAAVWRPSALGVHRGDDEGMKVVDLYLATALARLSPVFEYFSIFSDHAERAWLETVFAELRAGDWEALLAPQYERMLLPPHLGDRFLDHPRWVVLEDEDTGVLVQTREL